VRFVAPIDADFGGTWIGANQSGLSFCLLNGIGSSRGRTSRGLLVLDLLNSASAAEAGERVLAINPSEDGPFTLIIIEPGARAAAFQSDGRAVVAGGEPRPPLVSSSFDPAGVQSSRRREFERLAGESAGGDALQRFHATHSGGPPAYWPCTHRADAETVSFSRVRVSGQEVEFYYTPAAPCRGIPGQTVRLPLKRRCNG
jgi:hypothetical protein